MDATTIDRFLDSGFIKIERAFSEDTAQACADLLWARTGTDPDDPSSWTRPVHWVSDMPDAPFVAAANTPVLHDAFDHLVGPGRWVPRPSLGSFPLRFPHTEEPDDAGWHIEGSYLPEGAQWYYANLRSRDRALLMLFLFTETGPDDAPTRIRVGSHLDVPPVLEPFGEAGASTLEIAARIDEVSAHRPVALATGGPGDVYLCHPFLVHAARPHHGTRPRFMAQPPLYPAVRYELERSNGAYCPVETAIRRGLEGSRGVSGGRTVG
ncbi:phytanoyl-CoA dioxygenase family protein [Streptomyces sp. H10-C2]|uniref:phytanoyl-CoA dioxygenase family protein n=1 Tax=unclassified Streptomyces TaxID=2593676 RepID=UPI0024BA6773|nr:MULTISPECIES: phytanoyl-CoA dioxygenase family protein [unclassified Streptomyces]MDJ0343019.1 phytanoyl-CoA dioxygenase family protein [Streptomyces sp. PH10-H1]MDJ0371421.1 phytanoyl-CoA dioxygenase family protein [Streptomyces sp. H10-C2]